MNEFLILDLKVIPNKKRNKLIGAKENGIYRLELKAKPIEGQANHELVKFLGKLLGIMQNQVTIIRGIHSNHKIVKIDLIDKKQVLDIINNEVQPP